MLRVRRLAFVTLRVSSYDMWDPALYRRVGTLEHVGGDFACDAWGASGEIRL
jgi:hypothetical protein